MAVRFYNPGFAFREMMKFDHPSYDPAKETPNSYFYINADSQSFFDVDTALTIETINGPLDVSVPFPKLVKDQLRFSRCVVMVEPGRDVKKKPIEENDNVALTEKEAKTKAESLWKDAMLNLVREHEDRCREARDRGSRPQRAKGNIKHALDALGIEDPANDIEDVVQRKQDTSEVGKLKAELDEMKKLILNLAKKG